MDSFYTEVLLFLSSFYFPPLVMTDGNSVRELFKEGRNLPHFIFCTVKNEILIKTTFLFSFFYPKINSLLETKHIPAELWETLN